jgi:hypothetical protein
MELSRVRGVPTQSKKADRLLSDEGADDEHRFNVGGITGVRLREPEPVRQGGENSCAQLAFAGDHFANREGSMGAV